MELARLALISSLKTFLMYAPLKHWSYRWGKWS